MKQLDIIELANEGKLKDAPKNFVDQAILLKKNSSGKTTFQLLAQKGHVNQIPKEQITKEVLLTKDSVGACGLHYLARSNSLDSLPSEFLEDDYMGLTDYFGNTVKDYNTYGWSLEIRLGIQSKGPSKPKTCEDMLMEF
jgi:hypothetical protein